MSTVQEVEEALRHMTVPDRNRVKAYLLHLGRADEPAYKAEVARRLERMAAGQGVSQDKIESLHTDLARRGA